MPLLKWLDLIKVVIILPCSLSENTDSVLRSMILSPVCWVGPWQSAVGYLLRMPICLRSADRTAHWTWCSSSLLQARAGRVHVIAGI